jgi:DNA-directed RNA polymerase subunit H (RpoH/RPB5)
MHILQPKHIKMSPEESEKLLKDLNITKAQLPKILLGDVGLPEGCQVGDLIRLERKDGDGIAIYYRVVV